MSQHEDVRPEQAVAERDAATATDTAPDTAAGARPLLDEPQNAAAGVAMWLFVIGPPICLLVAVPLAWGWGVNALDLGMAVVTYLVSGLGIAMGYHRLFTHRSFKARRGLRIALAIAGSLGVEGSPVQWVANHRRHHAFADREGDPHSPWRYGNDTRALLKGLVHAHIGWMLKRELSNRERFAPDIAADPDMQLIGRLFGLLTAVSLLGPGLVGGLVTGTWSGALAGFFWAGLMRMALLHHVTWSVNSICHVAGKRPFASRDKATNFWPLALLSFGESWHNSHHADPTCARHGVLPGQLDIAARLIWIFEKLNWVHDVRWPSEKRRTARALPGTADPHGSAA
ncbi:acyl-CoA desaturase [Streptomyces sp. TS71-3]|uniref:acyl-CoA desaturase n=1 Tax=Streptomyces sp. TS71-3 TaxID=2733862 RepID=UPI001B2A088F|nr:acyl-CoA desaturase [Streptomyces sp. TS71-3]GHJ37495.1 stearoyl-CoA desaturase [Streptomyces sp. TS71-3]